MLIRGTTAWFSPEEAAYYADLLDEVGKTASAAYVRREVARIVAEMGDDVVIEVPTRPDVEMSN